MQRALRFGSKPFFRHRALAALRRLQQELVASAHQRDRQDDDVVVRGEEAGPEVAERCQRAIDDDVSVLNCGCACARAGLHLARDSAPRGCSLLVAHPGDVEGVIVLAIGY